MSPICWLNGEIRELEKARISPLDRGFIFGESLYEVIKILDGKFPFLDLHLKRLSSGLRRLEIGEPPNLGDACVETVRQAEVDQGSLYLQVSRGAVERTHVPPRDMDPTCLIIPSSHHYASAAGNPHRAIAIPDPRWAHCDLKSNSLMATVQGKLAARDAGADEVLFVGAGGRLREGGNTNLFVRRAGRLVTHPLDGRVLPGVTRWNLIELAAELGFAVEERAPRLSELETWEEAFLCGTLTGVQPLVELDEQPIAAGVTGSWTRALAEALAARESALVSRTGR